MAPVIWLPEAALVGTGDDEAGAASLVPPVAAGTLGGGLAMETDGIGTTLLLDGIATDELGVGRNEGV